jgi:glycosyltransferase involved in cell wall biosynthesis
MSRRRRVAFFAEILIDDFDGASRTMYHIINRIPRDEYDFTFVCGVPPTKEIMWPVIEVPTLTIPLNNTYKMAMPLWKKAEIYRKLDAFGPDVIHIATPSPLGEMALDYARARNLKVITIYHTHFVSYIQFYLKRLPWLVTVVESWMKKRLKRFYNQCHLVYVPSKSIMAELTGYGINAVKMQYWPRALNEGVFVPQKRDEAWHQATAIHGPIILYASRMVWEKNVQTLIDLYHLAERKSVSYTWVIAGDGVAEEKMRQEMPKAKFLGKLDHESLAQVYASADVFVFTSITESYGNVVIEAMASGLPCVIADGGGSADFIDHGRNGFLVEPRNADDYLQKIQSLIADPKKYEDFRQAGIQYVASLSWAALVQKYFSDVDVLSDQKSVAP